MCTSSGKTKKKRQEKHRPETETETLGIFSETKKWVATLCQFVGPRRDRDGAASKTLAETYSNNH